MMIRSAGLRRQVALIVAFIAALIARGALPLCVLGAAIGIARAQEHASRWDGDARSAVRLIAGSAAAAGDARLRAGIEIRLKAGWHTYWRHPGDAGVPPRLDFAGSANVKAVDVAWPAPQRIPEEGLTAIGYTGSFILPLVVSPQDPARPARLRLKVEYAVCEKLCVPAEARADLALAGGPSPEDDALRAAEARLPRKLALGEGAGLAIRSVRRERGARVPRVVVDVAAPTEAKVELFAEGPGPEWSLPVPTAVAGAPIGLQRFTFDLDGAPPGARQDDISLTLTAVTGSETIEVTARLD
jgi:DsbC/DsbD-like thiol-disulfide interchange protein